MKTAIGAVLITLLVLVTLWILVFGTAGAMLSKHSRFSSPVGFLLGALLGPIGLLVIWLRRHSSGNTAMTAPTGNLPQMTGSTAYGADEQFSI